MRAPVRGPVASSRLMAILDAFEAKETTEAVMSAHLEAHIARQAASQAARAPRTPTMVWAVPPVG